MGDNATRDVPEGSETREANEAMEPSQRQMPEWRQKQAAETGKTVPLFDPWVRRPKSPAIGVGEQKGLESDTAN